MNRSHLAHALIGMLIMALVWAPLALLGLPSGEIAGAAAAIAFYLGREHAQHEYKLGTLRGWQWGQTLPVKWYEGLTHGWSRDSLLDILAPAVITISTTSLISLI